MWFATTDGLNRYDGYEVKNYLPVPFDSTALSSGYIWGISEDESGALWIGTRHGGLNRMDPVTGEFEWFQHDENDSTSIGGTIATHVLDDGEKYIWVASGGLSRTDRLDPGKFVTFKHDPGDESSLSNRLIFQLHKARDGTIWVATTRGLNRLDDPERGRFTRFLTKDDSGRSRKAGIIQERSTELAGIDRPDNDGLEIVVIVERAEEPGVFWMATDAGLIRFDTNNGASSTYLPDGYDPEKHEFSALVQDPRSPSVLWTSVYNMGLLRFDIRSKRFLTYAADPASASGLASNRITSLYADRSGSIWVAHEGHGVDRFNSRAVGFGAAVEITDDEADDRASVWSVHEDRAGILWVGAQMESNWAVFAVDRINQTTTRFDVNEDLETAGPEPIWAIHEDRQGQLWIGSSDGLCQFNRQNGTCSRIRPDPDNPHALINGLIRDIMEDQAGNLWIGTNGALHRMRPDQPGVFTRFHTEFTADSGQVAIPGNWVRNVMEDQAGFIWAASDGGLTKIDPNSDRIVSVYKHDPRDNRTLSYTHMTMIHEREREPGVFWVGTFGGGLNRVDDKTGDISHFTTLDGLPSNVVYGILEDADGRLWLSTNRGISRFDPDSENFRNYGTESGLKSLSFQMYAHEKNANGEMFFGGIGGLHSFFPNELLENVSPPQIALVDVKVSNESIQSSNAVDMEASLAETEELNLSHDQRDLSFEFVAFHYADPGRNEYAYMLEGYNDDWVQSGQRRNASFTNLEPGEYTFRVKAANSDGIWNEEGVSMRVVIAPPWWRTWWAYGLYAFAFIGGVFVVDRAQRSRLKRKEERRAQQKELEHAKEIETAYNELRTTQDRLVQSEKMASLGQLTAGIAHEIKNPLNFVNNFSDLSIELVDELTEQIAARRSEMPDDLASEIEDIVGGLRVNVQKINEHGQRADSIVYGMLQHSRTGEAERAEADINALVDEHLNLAYHGMRARTPDFNAALETDYGDDVGKLEVLPQDLGRVMLNLIGNAFDALHEHASKVTSPTVTVSTTRSNKEIVIRVRDNGPGIPDDIKSKIFEPFFTTKPTGSGTGLGLSMSYDIVTKGHGGELTVESTPGEGATFIVRLPA